MEESATFKDGKEGKPVTEKERGGVERKAWPD